MVRIAVIVGYVKFNEWWAKQDTGLDISSRPIRAFWISNVSASSALEQVAALSFLELVV